MRSKPRRDLVAQACKLYPTLALRKRWVRARERLGDPRPSVIIGIKRADTSRAARTLREAGIHSIEQDIEIPEFIKRLIKPH